MIVRRYPERTTYHRRLPNNSKYNIWGSWLYQREIGCPPPIGLKDRQQKDVYSSIRPICSWDQSNSSHSNHGGVFNLEFSPDGRILIAACERKSILVFDALNGRSIDHIDHAHNDCVNCVRFLDSRVFATCSDDTTVALWDVRYLKHRIRSLRGHSNWVKNIEYASNSRLLVTSGFDGSIYTWDINRYTEDVQFRRVFHTDGLMRTKLTPDESKLILCTTGGYLMVVNNLDLSSLAGDLQAFNPNMYRQMQLLNTPIPNGCNFNHVFTAKHNRVELISDFPQGNDAEVISSLQIHPQGWCALSRNTSSDNNSEWTCVHDIQDLGIPIDEQNKPEVNHDHEEHENNSSEETLPESSTSSSTSQTNIQSEQTPSRPVFHIHFSCRENDRNVNRNASEPSSSGSGTFEVQLASPDILELLSASHQTIELNRNQISSLLSSTPQNDSSQRNQEPGTGEQQQTDNASDSTIHSNENQDIDNEDDEEEDTEQEPVIRVSRRGISFNFDEHPRLFIRTISQLASRTMVLVRNSKQSSLNPDTSRRKVPSNLKIHHNAPRLTHFAKELNVGRGFIKELCFSTDGRLVCSPFGYGIRLLSFDSECRELCDVSLTKSESLHEVATHTSHSNDVVSTKFSPTHSLLVSGCLNGKICFHQPLLQ